MSEYYKMQVGCLVFFFFFFKKGILEVSIFQAHEMTSGHLSNITQDGKH